MSAFDVPLICPLCRTALSPTADSWHCETGHNFDIAKQGYVNLLPVHHKRSRDPGDSKVMIAARQRLLASGIYAPIASAVGQFLDRAPQTRGICLDAGCGEGYYLRKLALQDDQLRQWIGLDISKWAVIAAAKQAPNLATWLVASNASIPLPTGSVGYLLCLFGFPVAAEFARVLAADGYLLRVDPSPNHLRELREIVYPTLSETKSSVPVLDGFVVVECEQLSYQITLTNTASIADLLLMTPHLYRAKQAGREAAERLQKLTVTIAVELQLLRKTSVSSNKKTALTYSPNSAPSASYKARKT